MPKSLKQEWGVINDEIKKCNESPYYFCTKYLTVTFAGKTIPFTTPLSEEEFNKLFKKYTNK